MRLPGLIDIHVHLRDPGQTAKEDFYTGTLAAVAGGFVFVGDMPNNKKPIITLKRLKEKIKIAKKKAICDVGFYAGSMGDNLEELMKMEPYVLGLKLYLNKTTGNFLVAEEKLPKIFNAWKSKKPILFHAETGVIENILKMALNAKKRVHICHISSQKELETIISFKKKGCQVTCGVTPHYLFLCSDDEKKLKSFGLMRPSLKSIKDRDFLWKNLKYIDVIESDHAPHTIAEKKSENPPFGVPGLETTLPLFITAISQGKTSMNQFIEVCYENPKRIFNIKTDKNTFIEIDEKEEYIIDNKNLKTKCGWSPFNGWKVRGKVKRVFIRGKKVFEDGKIIN